MRTGASSARFTRSTLQPTRAHMDRRIKYLYSISEIFTSYLKDLSELIN